jgi:hypothetical protein
MDLSKMRLRHPNGKTSKGKPDIHPVKGMTDKFTAFLRQIGYSMRQESLMKFAASHPRTKHELLLEARGIWPRVTDRANKRLIGQLISLKLLAPCGTRPSKAGSPRMVPRYVLSDRGASVLREL